MIKPDSNKRIEEDNSLGQEVNPPGQKEFPEDKVKEENTYKEENAAGKEENQVDGQKTEKASPVAQKARRTAKVITSSLSAIAVALLASVVIIGGGWMLKDPSVKARISITGGHLHYSVSVENKDQVPLKIQLSGLTRSYAKEIDITPAGSYESSIADLEGFQGYSFKITGTTKLGSKTYYKEEFTTGAYVPIEQVNSISWNCQCTVDGYAYYTLNYEDDMNYWSHFQITIASAAETHSWYIADPASGKENKIDVLSFTGGSYGLTLKADSTDPAVQANGSKSQTVTLFPLEGQSFEVKI